MLERFATIYLKFQEIRRKYISTIVTEVILLIMKLFLGYLW